MEQRKLEIAESYLNDILKQSAIKTVGEVMSNIESISDLSEMKMCIKNTIYQSFRDLSSQIKAFDYGVKFIRPLVR